MSKVILYFGMAVVFLFWAVVFLASVGVVGSWSLMDPPYETEFIE